MATVSVIMSAYNESEKVIKESIDSILSQDYCDIEFVIVLDNPSNTALLNSLRFYESFDERVILLINDCNLGLARSLNKAIEQATGQFICRMDADDIAEPQRIKMQLHYLQKGNLDLVGSAMTVIGEDGVALYSIDTLPTSVTSVAKALKYNNCVPHPTWFGTKEVFSQGYRLVPLCEDYDFLTRAILAGFKVGNVPMRLLRYRMSSESISRNHLFEQFLYQIELTRAYRKGAVLDIDSADSFVKGRVTLDKSNRYSQANYYFNKGLASLRLKRYPSAFVSLAHIPVLSREYLIKIYRLAMASLVR